MIRDLEYKGKFTNNVKEVLEEYFGEDFIENIVKIGEVAKIGEIKEVVLKTYPYLNKYDIQEDNAEICFIFDKGRVEIFDGLKWKGCEAVRYINIYDENNNSICQYDNEELDEAVTELEDILDDVEVVCSTEMAIKDLKKQANIYVIDVEIDLNKFNEKEREILQQALKILKIA